MPNRPTKRAAKRRPAPSTRQQLIQTRRRCPKVSRSKLRGMRDELQKTRSALTDTLRVYWITPESELRGRMAQTERLIGKAVQVLTKGA